jgi:hypothetical protein
MSVESDELQLAPVFVRVTRQTENPKKDRRKHIEPAFAVGECLLVRRRGCEEIHRIGSHDSWALGALPPLEEWTEPVEPTALEWYRLRCGGVYAAHHFLCRLIEKGLVTRAMIEEINAE